MTLFLFRRLPDSRSCCCYALVFCICIIFAALLTYRCDGKKNIYIYPTSSLLALRTFQISIIQFCFQCVFFGVLRCVLAVTCSARDELSEATVSRGVGPFFRPAFTCCLWKQPSDRTADLLDWAVTSPSIQQAHTYAHTLARLAG